MKLPMRFFKYSITIVACVVLALIIFSGGFTTAPSAGFSQEPTVFAHRGVSEKNVENSIQAFKNALSAGFTAIETDIRITKDKKLILFHDKSCQRLLNINEDITNLSWSEINQNYLYSSGKKTTNKIVSLAHLLDFLDPNILLYLDIKAPSKTLADNLINLLETQNRFKTTMVASDNILLLSYFKYRKPEIKVVLEGFGSSKEIYYFMIPKNYKPNFYSSFLKDVDESHMEFIRNNGLIDNRIVYGVNNNNVDLAAKFGLKHIIYDFDDSNKQFTKQRLDSILTINGGS